MPVSPGVLSMLCIFIVLSLKLVVGTQSHQDGYLFPPLTGGTLLTTKLDLKALSSFYIIILITLFCFPGGAQSFGVPQEGT